MCGKALIWPGLPALQPVHCTATHHGMSSLLSTCREESRHSLHLDHPKYVAVWLRMQDILAMRKSVGTLSGCVLVDGRPASSNFVKHTSYLPQVRPLLRVFASCQAAAKLQRPVEMLLPCNAAMWHTCSTVCCLNMQRRAGEHSLYPCATQPAGSQQPQPGCWVGHGSCAMHSHLSV
jgi:hypothetical protein